MAVTINGTTGIAGVDGSASTPAIQGTDTNTGIFFPAADTIAFGEGGAESARLNADAQFVSAAGTASLPVLTTTGDLNTGVFYPAADTVAWTTGGTERMRINSSGQVGIGTNAPSSLLHLAGSTPQLQIIGSTNGYLTIQGASGGPWTWRSISTALSVEDNGTERMRLTSDGALLVGTTTTSTAGGPILTSAGGFSLNAGYACLAANTRLFDLNRVGDDGVLVAFWQAGTEEGNISVSGTTVSYNGGHLSRWAQTQGPKDDTLLKGTVLSNLDEMNVYTDAEGNPVPNEQLNKVKVSDVEGDVNVAGVFVNWLYDEAHQVDEINMAMTGDMIIRIAQGVVVQKGDLLMSAGDGTAKPQGDDIVRSKTVAKVTSNHVTCTYEDGSYCVPCVLMAC